jgi:hypothetical protein
LVLLMEEVYLYYAIEIGHDALIYIPSFIKIGVASRKSVGRGDTHTDTHRHKGDRISLLLFFQNKESRLKMVCICSATRTMSAE